MDRFSRPRWRWVVGVVMVGFVFLGATKAYSIEKWVKQAKQGNPQAQYLLGAAYFLGVGVPLDYKKAVYWYRKAAEQGHAGAQSSLGDRYYFGEGIRRDYKKAVYWYRKAAEQGETHAQLQLGLCYLFGHGVPKNYVQAYKWLSLAAAQGNELAQTLVSDLEKLMTPSQIAKAQEEANKWWERHNKK